MLLFLCSCSFCYCVLLTRGLFIIWKNNCCIYFWMRVVCWYCLVGRGELCVLQDFSTHHAPPVVAIVEDRPPVWQVCLLVKADSRMHVRQGRPPITAWHKSCCSLDFVVSSKHSTPVYCWISRPVSVMLSAQAKSRPTLGLVYT